MFADVLSGAKTFEIRFNDRDFKVGDMLLLLETEHDGADMRSGAPLIYTGRKVTKKVGHILTGYGLSEGWCCLSFATESPPLEGRDLAGKLSIARDALDEIALAGMSGTGEESEEAIRDWHARQARKFIGIAARAIDALKATRESKAAHKKTPGVVDLLRECELFLRVLGLDSEPAAKLAADCRAVLATHPQATTPDMPASWHEAMQEALSVCDSVSMSRDRRVLRDGCVYYLQTEDWCKWAEQEVAPMLRAVLDAAPAPFSVPAPLKGAAELDSALRQIWRECHKLKGSTDGRRHAEAHALASWVMAKVSSLRDALAATPVEAPARDAGAKERA